MVCATCGARIDQAIAATNALPAGAQLQDGAFTIGKVLGQGGFGITYLGSDVHLGRAVAIKELFPFGSLRFGDTVQPGNALELHAFQEAKARFLEEARVLAQFEAPGIVRVYASFEAHNTAYMVMEYLRGKSFAQIVEEAGPMPEARAVAYIDQIGAALDTIHAAHLLHRDVKPENVVVTDSGRAVLIDFGSARVFAAGMTRRMTTTVTPGFAPLEQYGQHARFGTFTDTYALGATLYFLLTGQVPVQATDRMLGVELLPPASLRAGVTPAVNDAVMLALRLRPDERPQSVAEFLGALHASSNASPGARCETTTAPESLERVAETPTGRTEQRIAAIQARLETLARAQMRIDREPLEQCPGCRTTMLTLVTGPPTGSCFICYASMPKEIAADEQLDQFRCPVCRNGRLYHPSLGQSLWHRLAGRADDELRCATCRARFAVLPDDQLRLLDLGDHTPIREDIVAMQDQASPWKVWSRIAAGLSPGPTYVCQNCSSQYSYTLDGTSVRLITTTSDHWRSWIGQTVGVGKWYQASEKWHLAASGKRSLRPGLFCASCKTEFDTEGSMLRLIWAPANPLAQFVSQVAPADDWRRRGFNAPTIAEEQKLLAELSLLEHQVNEEVAARHVQAERLTTPSRIHVPSSPMLNRMTAVALPALPTQALSPIAMEKTHRIANLVTVERGQAICALSLSSDGRLLVWGTDAGEVGLWELTQSQEAHTLLTDGGAVKSVALTPASRLLVTGSHDGSVNVWSVDDGQRRWSIQAHNWTVTSVAGSPDGRLVASSAEDGAIKVWRVVSGEAELEQKQETQVQCLAFSPARLLLASGNDAGELSLWYLGARNVIRPLRQSEHRGTLGRVRAIAFSRDGRMLAAGYSSGAIHLWDVQSESFVGSCKQVPAIESMAFSHDRHILASGSEYGAVSLWDTSGRHLITQLKHPGVIKGVAISPDGRMLFSASSEGSVKLWGIR
jgi:predicted Ser/Thr protein kinase